MPDCASGFLVGAASLVAPILAKTRDSFNVDTIAQVVGSAAFADLQHAERGWLAVRAERRRLTDALRGLGLRVPESQANFLLAQAADGSPAKALLEHLRQRGIVVRHFDTPRLANSLRITVGTPAENDTLLAALGEVTTEVPHPL